MARKLIDCVGKAVKAGRLNQDEAALLLQRTERFAHLTKEQAELNAANSVLTEQMTELSNLEKQVGPPGKAEVVFKTKDKDAAMAMMFHEAQVVTEQKFLAKQQETEGEGAIKTQRQVAVEKEIEAVIAHREAFHGTPHEITTGFSSEKIGTGEGAQVFGYGHYVAEHPEVAGTYARGEGGKLYKVRVLGDEANYLDWDKPFKEQSEDVKASLRAAGLSPDKDMTGADIYQSYEMEIGGKATSELLEKHGILGIRFLDQKSREAGKGTRNYVVFDPENLQIIEKSGKKVTPTGAPKETLVEKRLAIYQTIKEKLGGLIARHAAEIQKLEFKAGMTIGASEGLTAEEIATQEIDKAKLGEIDKAKLLSALGELDALLKYLPAEVKGRVGGFYQLAKGSMGEKTLTEFFSKRIRMVEREFERVLVGEYREVLDKLLKSTKPRRRENKVRSSTLGPDVQDEMDLARRASVLNAAQVADTLDKIEASLQKEGLSDEARVDLLEEWAIVNAFGDLSHRNAEDLAAAYEWLAGEAKSGREQWQAKEEARREKTRGRVEKVLNGLPAATEPGLAKLEKKDLASIARQIVLSHFSYQQFLEHVLPETAAFKKEWADRARRADVKTQDQALEAGNRLTATLQGVVGSQSRVAMANALWSLKEVHEKAVTKGGEAFPMSKLHAVQYLLTWAQPDVREKMINTGWKQESIDQMVALTSDDKSQAVMAFLRQEYANTYKLLNPIYRRMFGMNMPRIENYAPTYYETTKTDTGMDPFGSPMAGSGLTPGLLKARVAHDAKIRHVDALSAYWQHVGHAYHWANYAELMREMRGVLNDTEVFGAIKQKHGQPVGELVNSWLDALGRQGMSKAADVTWLTRMIDGLVGAKAVSTLGLNLRSVAMQTDSAMRAILAVPMRRVIAAMTDRNFISNVTTAWKSDTVQRRVMSGGTPEAKYLFDRTQFRPSMLLELSRYSMVPMQWTDGFLTSISSAIVYTDAYNEAAKSGVTAEQAEAMAADAMDEAVYRYSQPVGLSAKSLMEVSGGAIRKMFMLFMSDPRLKTALMADSFISLAKGQGKAGDHVRRLVGIEAMSLVSLLIQNLYRDMFSDDEDEEIWTMGGLIRALTLPMLSGWFVLGTVAEIGITTAVGEKAFEPSRDPTIDAWKRANQAFRHLDDLFDTDDPNAMLREWDNIARGAALAGGVFGPIGAAPGVGLSVLVNVLKPLVGAYENVQKEE